MFIVWNKMDLFTSLEIFLEFTKKHTHRGSLSRSLSVGFGGFGETRDKRRSRQVFGQQIQEVTLEMSMWGL